MFLFCVIVLFLYFFIFPYSLRKFFFLLSPPQELAAVVSTQILEESLLPLLFELAKDRVPNIRLNAVRTMGEVHGHVGEGAQGEIVKRVVGMRGDEDGDVKSEAEECKFGVGA